MINGAVVGIVLDNHDPDRMHRVLVKYPVISTELLGETKSSWCRMISPMAGNDRGLVCLPDVGTEVVLGFAYRSMSPYVLGAVYNATADRPEPYHNDDLLNNKRVFWSRSSHMVIFDDTIMNEKVEFGTQATNRLNVRSGPIWQSLDSSKGTITMFVTRDTDMEAGNKFSIKCTDFELNAASTIRINAGLSTSVISHGTTNVEAISEHTYTGQRIDLNPSSWPEVTAVPNPAAPAKHPPRLKLIERSQDEQEEPEEEAEELDGEAAGPETGDIPRKKR